MPLAGFARLSRREQASSLGSLVSLIGDFMWAKLGHGTGETVCKPNPYGSRQQRQKAQKSWSPRDTPGTASGMAVAAR